MQNSNQKNKEYISMCCQHYDKTKNICSLAPETDCNGLIFDCAAYSLSSIEAQIKFNLDEMSKLKDFRSEPQSENRKPPPSGIHIDEIKNKLEHCCQLIDTVTTNCVCYFSDEPRHHLDIERLSKMNSIMALVYNELRFISNKLL